MSKSHARRSPHMQSEKPPAPPTEEPPPPTEDVTVERGWRPGFRIALLIWLAGFIALLLWLVIDLLMGLWRR